MPVKYPTNTPEASVACARARRSCLLRLTSRGGGELNFEVQWLQVEAIALLLLLRAAAATGNKSAMRIQRTWYERDAPPTRTSTYLETDHLLSDFNSLERHEPVSARDSVRRE